MVEIRVLSLAKISMIKICYILFPFLLINTLIAQTPRASNYTRISVNNNDSIFSNTHDEVVYTPFGPALKSNVHFVDGEHNLNIKNGHIQLINKENGTVSQEYDNVLNENYTENKENITSSFKSQSNFSDSEFKDGWVTFADCQIYVANPNPTYFSTRWIVPSPPTKYSNQILYLFNALVGSDSAATHIVQPVLQWGNSPAGGGNYWAICNWYVSSNTQYFYDSLIKVSPGTNLEGVIKLTSESNKLYNYNSSFTGYHSGLQVNNVPQLETPYVALEAFYVNGCDEFPSDEKIKMYNIQIMIDSIYPPLLWYTYNTSNDCGQFTKIVSKSSNNGQIDIHFHTPYSIDNFKEIHIYPNPVEDLLHISPNYIEDPLHLFPDKPITNCKIEIYNSFGRLLRTDFYENLDFEFNMDLRNFEPGLYIIKFSYDNKTHAFKIIKK